MLFRSGIRARVVSVPCMELFEQQSAATKADVLGNTPVRIAVERIMDRIWGDSVVVGGRTIDVHIRKIREKIGEERIRTIKGVGYKFEIEE